MMNIAALHIFATDHYKIRDVIFSQASRTERRNPAYFLKGLCFSTRSGVQLPSLM